MAIEGSYADPRTRVKPFWSRDSFGRMISRNVGRYISLIFSNSGAIRGIIRSETKGMSGAELQAVEFQLECDGYIGPVTFRAEDVLVCFVGEVAVDPDLPAPRL